MRKKREYKQTSWRLPVDVKETLESLAYEEDVPEIAIVRKAIRMYAEKHQAGKAQAS